MGVAFGIFPMTSAWLSGGQLVVPLSIRVPFADKLHFVHRKADARGSFHRAIGAWLREEYSALPPLAAGRIACQEALPWATSQREKG